VKRKALIFTAPGHVETREEFLPAPGAGEMLVETVCSAISAGTEMLVYQGRFPRDLEADPAISTLRGSFKYPIAYGYASAGIVRETGPEVDESWRGRFVFAFQPHASHFTVSSNEVYPIPDTLSPQAACFLPNVETAVNLVQDGAPILGERVLVLGQGVVGLLTVSLLKEFPLEALVTVDSFEMRCRMSEVECQTANISQCVSLDPDTSGFRDRARAALELGADLTYELSGNPSALNDAIALTAFSGRIVIGSWYGEKQVEVNLGGTFHRSRIRLISSQVSSISPELGGRWNKARRFDVAWKALERIGPEKWITHRFSLDQATEAYRLLDEHPEEAVQVIFDYSS
jgi:2-desacetyl-2-hydroxyethyl bacteriochlorophyllide A dehydrogenase